MPTFKWQIRTPKKLRNAAIRKALERVSMAMAEKRCINCDERPVKGQQRCHQHAALGRAESAQWYRKNGRVRYVAYKAKGLCPGCGHPSKTYTHCGECRAVRRHQRRNAR